MVIRYEKRNKFAKDLMSTKYRSRVVKPRKGKVSIEKRNSDSGLTKALHQIVE